jgi:tripartite-type tricarboxylate transporter receptor subunit TctC
VIVENRSGGSGVIAVGEVARAQPDGNTIGIISSTTAAVESLQDKLPYNLRADIQTVGLYAWMYNVLIVNPSIRVSSVRDLVERLRRDQLAYGSDGHGSAAHLTAELFALNTGTKLTHVPYRGAAPAVLAVVSDQVQLMFASAGSAIPQVKSGAVRGLAVTAMERVSELPDVPTLRESGFDFDVRDWVGVIVPAQTPARVIAGLHEAISSAVMEEKVDRQLSNIFVIPARPSLGPQGFSNFLMKEVEKWGEVVRKANVTLN